VIKLIVYLAIIIALVYAGSTVMLGKRTFFGHVRAIWHTEEVQDLKEGVKDTAGPTVDKLERGAKAGYNAMTNKSDAGAVDSGSATPAPATP
jgi:hypothetical protein